MEGKEAELQVLASHCTYEQTLCKLNGTAVGLVIGMPYHASASTIVLSVWQHVGNACITSLLAPNGQQLLGTNVQQLSKIVMPVHFMCL